MGRRLPCVRCRYQCRRSCGVRLRFMSHVCRVFVAIRVALRHTVHRLYSMVEQSVGPATVNCSAGLDTCVIRGAHMDWRESTGEPRRAQGNIACQGSSNGPQAHRVR